MEESLYRNELISRFTWIDYLVFIFMLAMSAAIGIFYGCFAKKAQDSKEFLVAGRSMTAFPVSMSLIASFISAISLLGIPSEVYQTGFVYWLVCFSYVTAMPVAAYVYLPVFWEIQVTSAFEYLELRFNKACRRLGSIMFMILMMLYMAIVVYAPALALSQVTGIHVYLSVTLISFVSLFYTTIGGIKAVLWTDALQLVIMYVSLLFIIIKGTIDIGGIERVWYLNSLTGRTRIFDFDPDPRTRHTFWTLAVGSFFTWLSVYGVNQTQVQRYMCVKEKYLAVRALWINSLGFCVLVITCVFAGLLIHAHYFECDPLISKLVTKPDQLFPLYVMDHFGKWRGLPGLFVAGIFSGALSTVSSGINSLSAITLEDFIKGGCYANISEERATIISKILSVIFGLLSFVLVLVAEQLGNVLTAAYTVTGITSGPMLAIFTLGMFFPWMNSTGAFGGTMCGLVMTMWVTIGNQVVKSKGYIEAQILPVNNCTEELEFSPLRGPPANPNFYTSYLTVSDEADSLTEFYKMSYLYYSAYGFFISMICGLIIGLATGKRDIRTLNPKLLSPVVTWFRCIVPNYSAIGADFVEPTHKDAEEKPPQKRGKENLAFEKNPRDEMTEL